MDILYWPLPLILAYRFLMRKDVAALPEVETFSATCDQLIAALPSTDSWLRRHVVATIQTHQRAALALTKAGLTGAFRFPK